MTFNEFINETKFDQNEIKILNKVINDVRNDWLKYAKHKNKWEVFSGNCGFVSDQIASKLIWMTEFENDPPYSTCGSYKSDNPDVGMTGHCWVVVPNRYIIDATIDQFENTKTFIRDYRDKRYVEEK